MTQDKIDRLKSKLELTGFEPGVSSDWFIQYSKERDYGVLLIDQNDKVTNIFPKYRLIRAYKHFLICGMDGNPIEVFTRKNHSNTLRKFKSLQLLNGEVTSEVILFLHIRTGWVYGLNIDGKVKKLFKRGTMENIIYGSYANGDICISKAELTYNFDSIDREYRRVMIIDRNLNILKNFMS